MSEKHGRNDPCPCGSGKKYKQCCLKQAQPTKLKFKAVVLNQPKQQLPNLMDRTFGKIASDTDSNTNLLVNEPYPEKAPPPTSNT
jgi:hypothetical protein